MKNFLRPFSSGGQSLRSRQSMLIYYKMCHVKAKVEGHVEGFKIHLHVPIICWAPLEHTCTVEHTRTMELTVKIQKFGTPQTIAIIVLKIEKFDVTLH